MEEEGGGGLVGDNAFEGVLRENERLYVYVCTHACMYVSMYVFICVCVVG